MDRIQAFQHCIDKARKVGIISHSRPDGDAMGCCISLRHFLHCRGLETRIFLEDRWPEAVDYLTEGVVMDEIVLYNETPEKAQVEVQSCDLLIFADLNNTGRTGSMQVMFEERKAPRILIDHHLHPHEEEFDLIFSETEISSASELLLSILRKCEGVNDDVAKLPAKSLEAVMTGITTDTNNFDNSVFPSTLRAVSDLLAAGVDRDRILASLYHSYPERRIRLMGHLMSEVMTISAEGVACITLDAETTLRYGILQGETEGFVNIPLGIDKVRMSIFIREDHEDYRVSVRSKKGTSANRIATLHFNGGGHENAAGGRLHKADGLPCIADVKAYVDRVTKEFFENEQ